MSFFSEKDVCFSWNDLVNVILDRMPDFSEQIQTILQLVYLLFDEILFLNYPSVTAFQSTIASQHRYTTPDLFWSSVYL